MHAHTYTHTYTHQPINTQATHITPQANLGSLQSLSAVPGLRKLALLGCKLGDAGAAALAQHLQHASEMRVQHEPGENQGGFQDLKELVLSGCGFSREGVEGLLQALASGRGASLSSIEMGGNPCCQADDFQVSVSFVFVSFQSFSFLLCLLQLGKYSCVHSFLQRHTHTSPLS